MTEPARQPDPHETQLARLVLALRSQGVTDPAVLAAIERTPREDSFALLKKILA